VAAVRLHIGGKLVTTSKGRKMVLPRNMIQFGSLDDIFWLLIAKVYHLDRLLMTKLYHIYRQNHLSHLERKGADVVT
jgi:hypothetical protein